MLILSRKLDEAILIGEGENQVRVVVVELREGKVRLGFSGDPKVRIMRSELVVEEKKQ